MAVAVIAMLLCCADGSPRTCGTGAGERCRSPPAVICVCKSEAGHLPQPQSTTPSQMSNTVATRCMWTLWKCAQPCLALPVCQKGASTCAQAVVAMVAMDRVSPVWWLPPTRPLSLVTCLQRGMCRRCLQMH